MSDQKVPSNDSQDSLDTPHYSVRPEAGLLEKAAAGGAFRAAVLGGNDGLVSNFSIVCGVAGGTNNPDIILLAGAAGLFAGAFSMAAGEYVSVRAYRDLAEFSIEKEHRAIKANPEQAKLRLYGIYRDKGLTEKEAQSIASRIIQNHEVALETITKEHLGFDANRLLSPWISATSSFAAFATGALFPLIPYIFRLGDQAFMVSGGLSGLALLTTGASLSHWSGKHPFYGGLRMLLIGISAATITFGIGNLVGIQIN
ncbi:MAG: putative Fe2+/Mn2+ transporter, VIT1/CCC1 family [Chloroflexi bacterium]|jgi:VIT1/CCC1 family predicted Fe2+/Mn2+ transporter|nr:MAG: putative Fe2+/Mn2+ transporter, VIT1/CCC1 family [Chloroflexota bacterium]